MNESYNIESKSIGESSSCQTSNSPVIIENIDIVVNMGNSSTQLTGVENNLMKLDIHNSTSPTQADEKEHSDIDRGKFSKFVTITIQYHTSYF